MLKIKAYHFNPINVVCIILLVVILAFVAAKPAQQEQEQVNNAIDKSAAMKDYQLQILDNGKQVILWDRDRIVSVLPLDNKCNLSEAIWRDNE